MTKTDFALKKCIKCTKNHCWGEKAWNADKFIGINTFTHRNRINITSWDYLPLFGWDLVQRTFRPLARRRFKIALPPVVDIRMRKPWVRANDFRDLLLLVWARAALPALTTRPRPFSLLAPTLDVKSNPSDKPEHWEINWDQVKLNLNKNFNYIHAD